MNFGTPKLKLDFQNYFGNEIDYQTKIWNSNSKCKFRFQNTYEFGMINKALDNFHVKTMNQLIFLLLLHPSKKTLRLA